MHAPSAWGFIALFFSLLKCIVSVFHWLSLPSCDAAVFLLSGMSYWSGDRDVHHVRLVSLPYYPEICGRLQSPVKCQRGALNNLSQQTLPQDTADICLLFVVIVLFFYPPNIMLQKKTHEHTQTAVVLHVYRVIYNHSHDQSNYNRFVIWRKLCGDNKWCRIKYLSASSNTAVIRQILPLWRTGQITLLQHCIQC